MKNIGTVTLEKERLILRKVQEDDYISMFNNWASDPRVTKYMTWKEYENVEALKNTYHKFLMENKDKSDFYSWKIVLKSTNEPIGQIDVVNLNEEIESVEIGYCLGYNFWHKGIMTEAFKVVIKFLFEQVGVNRIEATHDKCNPHSGDVMKKCGLQYEGTLRQGGKNISGICDKVCYAILKEDYIND